MKVKISWNRVDRVLAIATIALLVGSVFSHAQTVTSDPQNGATGVSTTATVTFTFSAAVDPNSTTATFYSLSPPGSFPVNSTWSSGNTVLTCTPISPFPDNSTISWLVSLTPIPAFGSFTTGTGGGGGGGSSGTNAITTFSVGKLYLYEQSSPASPAINTNGYGFTANVGMASNRTASAVTVTIPGASVPTSLTQNFVAHEDFYFVDFFITNQTTFETTYPQGNFVFNVTGTPSNQQATVSMPMTMAQPNAPHILNFPTTQTVNAAQPVTVSWDPFQGGTTSDYIGLSLSDSSGLVFHTPYPGTNGVLTGTATAATIPAGKLSAGATYNAEVVFYRFNAVSNATFATFGYRATATDFNLITAGIISTVPVVSNPLWSGTSFSFDVATSANQSLKVLYSTNCALPVAQWQPIFSTNSPGTSVHITLNAQAAADGFFRLQSP